MVGVKDDSKGGGVNIWGGDPCRALGNCYNACGLNARYAFRRRLSEQATFEGVRGARILMLMNGRWHWGRCSSSEPLRSNMSPLFMATSTGE